MLPLHMDAQGAQKGQKFHAGLWYDRFFNQYDNNWTVGDAGKLNWIESVCGAVGDPNALKSNAAKHKAMVDALSGACMVMSTDWHFVTGLGNNHPVENGFAWHHTLGVPYLTGAAVKGMLRSWCEVWEEENIDIRKWFGDTEQSGELIFFDAMPIRPVPLKPDILTPHYGDWYAKGDQGPARDGSNVPADWHDPVPVPFLVVDKGASFLFSVAKRENSTIDLHDVMQDLRRALEWIGAGAKTAAGYGRMLPNEKANVRLREEQIAKQRAERTALEKQKKARESEAEAIRDGLEGLAVAMFRDASEKGWSEDKGQFVVAAGQWLDRLEAEDVDCLPAAASWLCKRMSALFPGIIENPDKTKGKKNKPVFKEAQRRLAHKLRELRKDG